MEEVTKFLNAAKGLITVVLAVISLVVYLLIPITPPPHVAKQHTEIPKKREDGPKLVCIDSFSVEQSEEELKKYNVTPTSESLAEQINKEGRRDTIVVKLLIQAKVSVKSKDIWDFIINHYDYSTDVVLRRATRIDTTGLISRFSSQFHDYVYHLSGHPEKYTLLQRYFRNPDVYTWLTSAIESERQKLKINQNKVDRMDTSSECMASFKEETEGFPLHTICRMFFTQAKSFDSTKAQDMGVAKYLILNSLQKITLSPGQDSIEVFKGIVRPICPEFHLILEADNSRLEDLVSFRNILEGSKG